MHRHRNSELVHRSDAIGVAVGGKSHQGLALKHAKFQATEIAVDWFRIHSAKERVAIGAYSFNLKRRAAEEVLNPVPACSMHRIDDYNRRRSAQSIEIDIRSDLCLVDRKSTRLNSSH